MDAEDVEDLPPQRRTIDSINEVETVSARIYPLGRRRGLLIVAFLVAVTIQCAAATKLQYAGVEAVAVCLGAERQNWHVVLIQAPDEDEIVWGSLNSADPLLVGIAELLIEETSTEIEELLGVSEPKTRIRRPRL